MKHSTVAGANVSATNGSACRKVPWGVLELSKIIIKRFDETDDLLDHSVHNLLLFQNRPLSFRIAAYLIGVTTVVPIFGDFRLLLETQQQQVIDRDMTNIADGPIFPN